MCRYIRDFDFHCCFITFTSNQRLYILPNNLKAKAQIFTRSFVVITSKIFFFLEFTIKNQIYNYNLDVLLSLLHFLCKCLFHFVYMLDSFHEFLTSSTIFLVYVYIIVLINSMLIICMHNCDV